MTIPEIQALKRELEVALTQAFGDFHRVTGIEVARARNLMGETVHASVTIRLESL